MRDRQDSRPESVPEERNALELVARREFSLHAFIDLSQLLTLSLDMYHVVDNLLLNLMGQLQASRSCLWLIPEEGDQAPVLVKSRGVDEELVRTTMTGSTLQTLVRESEKQDPLIVADTAKGADDPLFLAASRLGLRLFAPIRVREEVLGLLALGPRWDGEPYAELDTQVLRASLAIAGVAVQNERFYGRLLEQNRELRSANERLRELDQLKSEFISNVNHELRTPLAAIIASLECVDRAENKPTPGDDLIRYASDQSRKLLAMIQSLLTFSEAERDTLLPRLVTGDVAAAVSEYYLERLPGVSSGLRELTIARPAGSLEAPFDLHHLRLILDALIDNAVKFTGQGARIQLRVHETDLDGQSWAAIDVADDGPGVPADQLPTLFETFRQLDGSMTRTVGGMGLGLSLARRLAEGLGGRLTATSEPGRGSTFRLLLPRGVQMKGAPADTEGRRDHPMTDEFDIPKPEVRGGTVLMRVRGRLDVKTAPKLLERITEIQPGGRNLVLNLSEVSFMGSSGIGALLSLVEQFREQGGRVRFAALSPAVDSVVKLLNLDRFLEIDPTESDALAALGA